MSATTRPNEVDWIDEDLDGDDLDEMTASDSFKALTIHRGPEPGLAEWDRERRAEIAAEARRFDRVCARVAKSKKARRRVAS